MSTVNADALRHRLPCVSPHVPIRTANFGKTPIDTIFDLQDFSLDAKLEIDLGLLREDDHNHNHDRDHDHACSADCNCGRGHERGHGYASDHHHHHGHTHRIDHIASFILRNERPSNYIGLEEFPSSVLNIYSEKPLHYKGMLYIEGTDHKIVFQGVRRFMGSGVGGRWDGETPSN